ncbi:hypothetical protein MGWOODY_Smn613 [hydrothermal vent metagenome]|uniref:Uncharacterized protein n=1 Tax=hydrothermal vent metagenome TaxID=652676 RepID=A0A160TJI9_9ZZZZ
MLNSGRSGWRAGAEPVMASVAIVTITIALRISRSRQQKTRL